MWWISEFLPNWKIQRITHFHAPQILSALVKSHLNKLGIQLLCKNFDLFCVWPSYLFLGATMLHISPFDEGACKYSHPEFLRKYYVHKNSFLTYKCELTLSSFVPATPWSIISFCSSIMKLRKCKYILVANIHSQLLAPFSK